MRGIIGAGRRRSVRLQAPVSCERT